MSNLSFVIGQIRALESKLLNKNQIDRMVGAKTPLDAFRVLIELEYADYIDDSTTPDDFETILDQGLQETQKQLREGTDDHKGLHILWGQADANNLKKAFKLRFLKNKKTIDQFDENHGFSRIGTLSQKDIENIVFSHIFPEYLPPKLHTSLSQVFKIWDDTHDILKIEYTIDALFFDYFQTLAKKIQDPFIKKMVKTLTDIHNVTALTRYVLLRENKIPLEAFIPGGSFSYAQLYAIGNEDKLLNFLSTSIFSSKINISPDISKEDKTMQLEKSLDRFYNDMVHEGQGGEINSIQVPLSYFYRRIQNAQVLKFIMFAKFNGLPPEVIYENLKTF